MPEGGPKEPRTQWSHGGSTSNALHLPPHKHSRGRRPRVQVFEHRLCPNHWVTIKQHRSRDRSLGKQAKKKKKNHSKIIISWVPQGKSRQEKKKGI
jgi:hypothetical protein